MSGWNSGLPVWPGSSPATLTGVPHGPSLGPNLLNCRRGKRYPPRGRGGESWRGQQKRPSWAQATRARPHSHFCVQRASYSPVSMKRPSKLREQDRTSRNAVTMTTEPTPPCSILPASPGLSEAPPAAFPGEGILTIDCPRPGLVTKAEETEPCPRPYLSSRLRGRWGRLLVNINQGQLLSEEQTGTKSICWTPSCRPRCLCEPRPGAQASALQTKGCHCAAHKPQRPASGWGGMTQALWDDLSWRPTPTGALPFTELPPNACC